MQCVHSVLGMPTPLALHTMRGEPLSDGRGSLSGPPCPAFSKLTTQARVLGWIQQRLDLRSSETGTDVRVLRQQLAKRPPLRDAALGRFIDGVMRALAPDLLAQLQHQSLGHD